MSWLGPNQLHGISCHRFGDIQDQVHQLEERRSRPRSGRLPSLSQIWTRKRSQKTPAFRLVDENWFPVKKFLSVNFLRAISRVRLAFKSFALTVPGGKLREPPPQRTAIEQPCETPMRCRMRKSSSNEINFLSFVNQC